MNWTLNNTQMVLLSVQRVYNSLCYGVLRARKQKHGEDRSKKVASD